MANKVLIIGDAMVDTYIYGEVERVSPEAPVPVITPSRTKQYLGGAGNVARNAAALGAKVSVFFTVGKDRDGSILEQKLHEWNINCEYLFRDDSIDTINKTRVIGNNQQIVRVDYNDRYNLTEEITQIAFLKLSEAISKADIIVISDYGKGTCSDSICKKVIELAGSKPIIVDPKGVNWEKYRGATIITPNMKEINTFSGEDIDNCSREIEQAYGTMNAEIGIRFLLLTRSEEGMSLIGSGHMTHIEAFSHEVFDVSGAGDTVVAAMAAYLDPDLHNIEEAARIANVAAGLVVIKPGTAVVTKEEVQRQLLFDSFRTQGTKIFGLSDYDELKKMITLWRTAGNTIVTANGCFDILHRGHIKLLKEAKRHGDKLIVAINSDASVKRLKGKDRPINSEKDRAFVISAIDAVDAVVVFDPFETPIELTDSEISLMSEKARNIYKEAPMTLMKLVMPDVHIKGGDYRKIDIPSDIC